MKPHCILGSCSAQFLSIMGWGWQRKMFDMKHDPEMTRSYEKKRGGATYNGLLVQNTSLQVSLFPEFSSHHQSHLEIKRLISARARSRGMCLTAFFHL